MILSLSITTTSDKKEKENPAAAPPMPVSYASALKRHLPEPAAPATPLRSPSLSPPPSPSSPSTPSPPSSPSTPSPPPSPSTPSPPPSSSPSPLRPTLPTPPPSPPPSSPYGNTIANRPHWAVPGRLAWLRAGRIGPSSIIRERLRSQENINGFESHPVLIWRAPNEDGIVKIIPINSFGGRSVEAKWPNGPLRRLRLQQHLMFEHGEERPHCGTEKLLFTKPFKCHRRSYLKIREGIYKIEVDCLIPYVDDAEPTLTSSSMSYISNQLSRFVDPRLWIDSEEVVEFQATAGSDAKHLTAKRRKL